MQQKRVVILALATVAMLAACQSDVTSPSIVALPDQSLSSASAGMESRVELPVTIATFVPCANNGAGEVVVLNGSVRVTTHTTVSPSGRARVQTHSLLQDVVGSGETSGTHYRGAGLTRSSLTLDAGESFRSDYQFRVVARGRGNDLVIHESLVHRVDADGNVTVSRLQSRVACR